MAVVGLHATNENSKTVQSQNDSQANMHTRHITTAVMVAHRAASEPAVEAEMVMTTKGVDEDAGEKQQE